MKKKLSLSSLSLILVNTLYAVPVVTTNPETGLGCGGGLGPIAGFLCKLSGDEAAQKEKVGIQLNTLIGGIIGFLTTLAALWFGFNFIMAGFQWISAGGDKGKVKEAKDKITQSVIGLAIVVAAYTIAGILGNILGLHFLNIGDALKLISPGGGGAGLGGADETPKK